MVSPEAISHMPWFYAAFFEIFECDLECSVGSIFGNPGLYRAKHFAITLFFGYKKLNFTNLVLCNIVAYSLDIATLKLQDGNC
jgi:hypothetical protein